MGKPSILVSLVLLLAGCAARHPPAPPVAITRTVETPPITTIPPGPDVPHPDIKGRLRSEVTAAIEVTDPITPVAIGFCALGEGTAFWEEASPDLQWYAVLVDGQAAGWGGVLTPTAEAHCYQTEKRYTFPAGDHTLTVALVVPAERVLQIPEPAPACDPPACTRCPATGDCYGGLFDPPIVVRSTSTVPPQPVDCVVSAWSEWSAWSDWTQNSPTTEQRSRTRTRTITTPPANGGAPCPPLSETEVETRPITPPTDVCISAPLTVIVKKWPGGQNGSRQGAWDSGGFVLTTAKFEWIPALHFIAIDSRGCTATVEK
jgi:hypothetical protein